MTQDIHTEQDYINAVHAECLKYHKGEIGFILDEQIRAHARVTYRFLKKLDEQNAKHLARIRALENEPSQ